MTTHATSIPFLNALFEDQTYDIGSAKRDGTENSKYDVSAGRLLKELLDYCWDHGEFAQEIIAELKCTKILHLGMRCFYLLRFI